jgi:hypothetical protein
VSCLSTSRKEFAIKLAGKPTSSSVSCLRLGEIALTFVDRWLYSLILTIDANFRLKNKERNLSHDVSLGDGWAFWVESTPYQEYFKEYGHQEEVGKVSASNLYRLTLSHSLIYVIQNFVQ